MAADRPTVAIAHDYLTQRGGAERVVLAMLKAFPGAPVYTTLYDPDATFPEFADVDLRVSRLNRFGLLRRHHRWALPLLAPVVSRTRIDAEVVLSSSSGWAHGVHATGRKIVYCYTPARWLYQTRRYLGEHPGMGSWLALGLLRPFLRWWDRRAARSADEYLTISPVVQDRTLIAYGLQSAVIPAPRPSTDDHVPEPMDDVVTWLAGESFELCVSRLMPYKNVRQVVTAYAEEPRRRLIVVGRGPDEARLRRMASDNVLFLSGISDEQLAWLYQQCRLLIAISHEDFGLTPLEAAAFGKPSIVLRWGGFVGTMAEGLTSVFVDEVSPTAVRDALAVADLRTWDAEGIREHADSYREEIFIDALRRVVKRHLATGTS